MIELSTQIEKLAYVGTKNAPRLKKLGIKTVRDLLWHFPFRYDDFSQMTKIENIGGVGSIASLQGQISNIKNSVAWRRRMSITDAEVEDETGIIHAIWFNQPYLERNLPVGTYVSLSGKISRDKKGIYLSNPSYEKLDSANSNGYQLSPGLTHTGRLVPVYPETYGVTSKYLRFLIKKLLDARLTISDPLPERILNGNSFPKIERALYNIHFPENISDAQKAKNRFAFEDVLLFQLRALRDRRQMQMQKAPVIPFNSELIAGFVKSLPFELTGDQKVATYEILKDVEKSYPMNRLLNGDVGSGKTVVALIAAFQTANAGFQTALMAPTEILAKQHFATTTSLLNENLKVKNEKGNIVIGLLIGSEARQWSRSVEPIENPRFSEGKSGPADDTENIKVSKKLLQKKIAAGEIDIVIGTHAVIQKDVKFGNLGLVVIDEQHRFGIEQRMKLLKNQVSVPHLLSMTATPIPRTLALTIYGDLDISLLKEKPKGRQEIVTRIVPHEKRAAAYKFIDDQIKLGRQVFVICPRIEISKPAEDGPLQTPPSLTKLIWSDVKAVTEEFERLSKQIFPHRRIAMLHGKLKPKEKDGIMAGFKNKHYDLIVSTSVIEVGVDIPNATIMMIESAERFGLAQLHQFRGRVGRGEHQSYCLLFASDNHATRRLKALEKTNNGFELAETDLKLRGPGEFAGVKQSGIPDLAMASLTDIDLIKKARLEAKLLLQTDPLLKSYPALLARLSEMQKMVHFE